jgi:hypothetical protein
MDPHRQDAPHDAPQDAEGESGGWRQVGSHVAVQVARSDTHIRRSRHIVAAALLAVACAAAVLVTLRPQRGEIAQLAPAKGKPAAIRVPGIRTAKQLLAEAARAAKAKKQKLAIQIPGIRPETQAIINSGEWDTKVRAGLVHTLVVGPARAACQTTEF